MASRAASMRKSKLRASNPNPEINTTSAAKSPAEGPHWPLLHKAQGYGYRRGEVIVRQPREVPKAQVASAKKKHRHIYLRKVGTCLGWGIIIRGVRLDWESHLRTEEGNLSPNMFLDWSTGPPKGEPLGVLHNFSNGRPHSSETARIGTGVEQIAGSSTRGPPSHDI